MTTQSKDYFKERKRRLRLDPEYREKENERQRIYRAANRNKVLESNRRSERHRRLKRYGLTYNQYQELLTAQDHACAICKTKDSGSRDWHVDHCHTTGIVRGILCHHCNLMLGNARDNIKILDAGIKYLEKI